MCEFVVLGQGKQIIRMEKKRAISELDRISKLREEEERKVYFDGIGTPAKYWLYNCYWNQLRRALNVDDIPF